MTTTIKAAHRLRAAEVKAATDTKGAQAYLKSVLSKYDLGLKSVKVDEDTLNATFKGPTGTIDVGFFLDEDNKKKVEIDFFDASGLEPYEVAKQYNQPEFLELKKSKDPTKFMRTYMKSMSKEIDDANRYVEEATACHDWLHQFTAALDEIRSNMD